MDNNLLLSNNELRVNRNQLKNIQTPVSTKTWKPVSHHEIAEIVVDEAEYRGYNVISEEYGLNNAGTKLFGVLRFHPQGHPEFSRVLGIRNSHDKSLSLGLTVGINVLVCSNLAFGGETTVFRKHTSRIDIVDLVPQAFDQLDYQYDKLDSNIQEMKEKPITMNQAKLLIVKAAEQNVIASRDILSTINEFQYPRHDEFSQLNQWSLFNAFTELAKKYSPTRADKCYRGLGKLFGLT